MLSNRDNRDSRNNEEQKRKEILRQDFKKRRSNFVAVAKEQNEWVNINTHLANNLIQLVGSQIHGTIASYRAREEEVDLSPLQKRLPRCEFAFPLVEKYQTHQTHQSEQQGKRLTFWVPLHSQAWKKGSFGIWEPDPEQSRQVELSQCVYILVPGVAFDVRGGRLGYGQGFYDRALSDLEGTKKIGVGFSMQISQEPLPCDANDVQMDWIVTEKSYSGKITMIASL